jgi:hypothetical protein
MIFPEHSGIHVRAISTDGLEVIAVSDVDSGRLFDLLNLIEQSQTRSHAQTN